MVMLQPPAPREASNDNNDNNNPIDNDVVLQQINSFDSIPQAFAAAHAEDDNMTQRLNAFHPTEPTYFYMIPCPWMESVCEYLQGRSTERPMNHPIDNTVLLLSNDASATAQLKLPLTYGLDYYLIGPHTWTLLSTKFGYNVELPRPVVVEHNQNQLAVQLSPSRSIPIPPNGQFECGMTIGYKMTTPTTTTTTTRRKDIVSEDEEEDDDDDDDLFPSLDRDAAPDQEPILMLPPSTTTTTTTSMVQPQQQQHHKKVYHAKGLGNLGNTCFMNSTLQCLAHTHPLRRYFLSGEYQDDLNRDNPLGAQGELATEFAKLLQEMWSTTNTNHVTTTPHMYRYHGNSGAVYPRSFKTTLGRHAEQFLGYDQHDSHELATYLLDALHEDTNRVTKKPYVEKPEQGQDEADHVAAAKAMEAHLQREDSRVLEQFVGLVKSRVQCPVESCGRVSTTFDPFMYLSVPIPGATDRTLEITFCPLNPMERNKKLRITLSKTASMVTLQKGIVQVLQQGNNNEYADLEAHDICLADVWSNEVYHFHKPIDELDKIRDSDSTFAFQLRSISSIQQELGDPQEVDMSWDTGKQYFDCHGTKLPLEVLQKFETQDDQDWIELMEPHVRQTNMFFNMFNPRRLLERLPEMIEFLHKLENFVDALHKCSDAHPQPEEGETTMEVEETPTGETKEEVLSDALSMEERCAQSRTFRNVKNTHDLGVLECCTVKLKSFITESLKGKLDENKDGIIVQVGFQRKPPPNKFLHSYGSISSSDKTFTLPLAMRIPPSMTVYELRQELGRRLSRSIKDAPLPSDAVVGGASSSAPMEEPTPEQDATTEEEMSTATTASAVPEDEELADAPKDEDPSPMPLSDIPIMDMMPLTYDNKSSEYSTYKASDRTLGMLTVSHDDHPSHHFVKQFHRADPSHPDEAEKVCNVVAQGGIVCVHWPNELSEERFDIAEYEACEEWKPPGGVEDEMKRTTRSSKKTTTVFDCIERYCAMEQLEDSEMWYCSRCKEHVRAWKQFHLYQAPPILIVHLKRFQYSATTHRRDKIDSYIDFPLEGLDLTKEVMEWTEEEKPIYDLYAVSNHFGGLGGGHYTAYALSDDGQWCNFDDNRVTTNVNPDEVKSSAAYVLYYRRRDVAVDDGVENLMTTSPVVETTHNPPAIVQDVEPIIAYEEEDENMSTTRQNLMYSDDELENPMYDFGSNGSRNSNMEEEEEEPNYFDSKDSGYSYGKGNDHDYPLQ